MFETLKRAVQRKLSVRCENKYKNRCLELEQAYDNWMQKEEEKRFGGKRKSGKREISDEFFLFAPSGGALTSDAVEIIEEYFDKHPSCTLLYADEDVFLLNKEEDVDQIRVLPSGRCYPFMKPIFSPETLFSFNYFGNIWAVRKSAYSNLEWFTDEKDLVSVYDFLLKATEQTINVGHIDQILYHKFERLPIQDSGEIDTNYLKERSRMEEILREREQLLGTSLKEAKIKEKALKRRNIKGRMECIKGIYYPRYDIIPNSFNCLPKVSIIIPSKDNPKVLEACIKSIRQSTKYPEIEILVVDNGSMEANQNLIQQMAEKYSFRYLYEPMEFNFSIMNNIAAKKANGEYLLLLNDDMEAVQSEETDWMYVLLGQAMQDGIGAVGAKLLYPNSTLIQHVGVTNAVDGPVHKLMKKDDSKSYSRGKNRLVYDVIGVTGACLMVKKEYYFEQNGLKEELRVAYNDVDLCFSLYERGFRNVIRNDVVFYHHESLSRGIDSMSAEKMERLKWERDFLYKNHPDLYYKDPYEGIFNSGGMDFGIRTEYGFEAGKPKDEKPVPSQKDFSVYPDGIYVVFERLEMEKILRSKGERFIVLQGYAVVPDVDNCRYQYKMVFLGEKENYVMPMKGYLRSDLSEAFAPATNLNLAGFFNWVTMSELPKGTYTVGIFAKDCCSRRRLFQNTRQEITIE